MLKKTVIFIIGIILFLWPVLVQGKIFSTGGIFQGDFLMIHFPNLSLFRQSLLGGRLPLWISEISNGYPLLAEGEIGALYLPNLLLLRFFPASQAIGILFFWHLLIAAFGMYLLVRHFTKSSLASLIAGFSFIFSGYMVTQLTEIGVIATFSWFPLLFLLWEKLQKKFRLSFLFIFAFILTCQILAGSLTIIYYELLVICIYGLMVSGWDWKKWIRSLTILVFGVFIGFGLSAIQLIPTTEFFRLSARANENIDLYSEEMFMFPKEGFASFLGFKPLDNPTWITAKDENGQVMLLNNPNNNYAYLGIFSLIALPFGFWLAFKKKKSALILILVLVFLLTLGMATPVFKIAYEFIPGMKYFRHSIRFLAFVEFFLVLLGAFGISFLEKHVSFVKKISWLILILVFLDLYWHQSGLNKTENLSFWLKPPDIFSQFKKGSYRISGYIFRQLSPGIYSDDLLQKELANFLPANYLSLFNLPSNGLFSSMPLAELNSFTGHNSTDPEMLTKIWNEQQQGKENKTKPLGDDFIKIFQVQAVRYFVSPFEIDYPGIHPVWQKNLTGKSQNELLTRIVSPTGRTIRVLDLNIAIKKVILYELDQPLPRIRLVSTALPLVKSLNPDKIFPSNFDPQKEILVSGLLKKEVLDGKGKVSLIKDEGNKVEITANTSNSSWLYFADTYYPDWKAYVDGKETRIYKANYVFRAIKVPKGNHKIIFNYDPLSFRMGMMISLSTIIGMVLVFIAYRRSKL